MSGTKLSRGHWSRRGFLQGSAAVAAGVWGLPQPRGHTADLPYQFDGSKFQLAAPEPNPKSGGVLRYGVTMRPPHFDIHQSGTINNLGSQACMFDNLIRRDPRDSGKTIIPDLAHSWDIAKDGKTYTFFLRQGVQFHDGAELTAEDVKATFDRISKPPQGINIPRSILFRTVSEINARDKYTVEFKLSEPRPPNFIMSAIASGWNVIVRKKTLEDNNYNLRKVELYPGTGPFKSVRRVENEVWVMEKNPNYWNKGLPYLDGIEFYHALPFSTELGSAILSGRVDYIRITDPVTARKAKATPGLSTASFNQSVIQATWVNSKRKPFDDPRVRRALHLTLDRPALVDVVKDVTPMRVGGFIYPFSEFATPTDELVKRLGYQTDPTASIKEARALMAAAGHKDGLKGLDFLVRDVASFKLWSQAVQAMLQEGLNVQTNLRTTVESVWFDDTVNGNYDLAIGAIVSTLLDPSDYFNAWYRKGGPQNYSFWDNEKFNDLVDQIDREVDPQKRLALIRQTEAIMEENPPLLPVAWEKINDVWYDYVKGHNPYEYFGVYDVVREDTFWLDKA
ncbi:MAG TPA: ABC transporter substrate-binding protein [Thermomicrobiales bacterium]|jgi:ABC-type transport system substrate-binding protein